MEQSSVEKSNTKVIIRRIIAQMIDLVAIVAIVFILFLAVGFVGGLLDVSPNTYDTISAYTVGLAGITSVGYSTILETIWNGQTVGKRLTGIRAVRVTGEDLTTTDAFVRNIPGIVSFYGIFYLVAIISMISNDYRQRMFDESAGIVVVKTQS